jgi:hypothetical protein
MSRYLSVAVCLKLPFVANISDTSSDDVEPVFSTKAMQKLKRLNTFLDAVTHMLTEEWYSSAAAFLDDHEGQYPTSSATETETLQISTASVSFLISQTGGVTTNQHKNLAIFSFCFFFTDIFDDNITLSSLPSVDNNASLCLHPRII